MDVEIVGNRHHITKLTSWVLGKLNPDNVAVITGPHGIGKKTIVHQILDRNGIEEIDPNSKEESHLTFAQFSQKNRRKIVVTHEYDDAKIQKYAQTLNHPIIFICTNVSKYPTWKARGNKKGGLVLYFKRPEDGEIRDLLWKKYPELKKEGLERMRGFIEFFRGDVRAMINQIEFWGGKLGPDGDGKRDHAFATPFDIVPTFFRGGKIEDHYENMWKDSGILKMIVGENYLSVKMMVFSKELEAKMEELKEKIIREGRNKKVTVTREKRKRIKDGVEKMVTIKKKVTQTLPINLDRNEVKNLIEIERVAEAADILSDGDMVDNMVMGSQMFELEPYACLFGIMGPGRFMKGRLGTCSFPTKKKKDTDLGYAK